jgi:cysteine desulfurase
MKRIYLDNNATTALDPRVFDAMLPALAALPANPSSVHAFGQAARAQLVRARESIAAYFRVKPHEMIFTSGGTESINHILRGTFASAPGHLITSDLEHSSIYNTATLLEKCGCSVTYLKGGLRGGVIPEQIKDALRPNTKLIMLGAVNSETGVKTDIEAIGEIALQAGVPFAVDGVALLGKEPFNLTPGISAIAFSGHKLHAPKGIGLTILRPSFNPEPLITGGEQEHSKRAGTENLAGILGLAKAIALLNEELPTGTERMRQLRDRFEQELMQQLTDISIIGEGARVVNTSCLSFGGVEGETLLMKLDLAGLAASHGSACASGALEPSRVLRNMGLAREKAASALRFSLSRQTTSADIDDALTLIRHTVSSLRHLT